MSPLGFIEVSFKLVGENVENPCWKHILVDELTETKVVSLLSNFMKYVPFNSSSSFTI